MDEAYVSYNLTSGCPLSETEALHSTWTTHLGQCVLTRQQYAAFIIGLSSNLFWLVAQAPQMITNCMYKSADKSLSFWFLMSWLSGDVTNLLGAFLTNQLVTQKVTAVYFVSIDFLMMLQFLYYVGRNQGRKGFVECLRCPCYASSAVMAVLPGLAFAGLLVGGGAPALFGGGGGGGDHASRHVGRTLLSSGAQNISWDSQTIIGYILGCISALLYVSSRLPQIIKNFSRCSVEGLALPMFIMAVLGNVTYALGILLYSVQLDFIILRLPWLVGSVGTVCFDFTIFAQFIAYKCFKCPCVPPSGYERVPSPGDDEEIYPRSRSRKLNGNIQCGDEKAGGRMFSCCKDLCK
ncbi:hypothetical protein EMCRGX_G016161 [Ephydatia muelleri]